MTYNRDSLAGTPNIGDLIRKISSLLLEAEIDGSAREAKWMVSAVTGLSYTKLIVRTENEISSAQLAALEGFVQRRLEGEPLQYILGEAPFRSWIFRVDQRVLIPRPETEMMVDLALAELPGSGGRVLDVGTGSGCIAISLKLESPRTQVKAIDISPGALQVARRNAAALEADVDFEVVDILRATLEDGGGYDVVVSNPPYIPYEEASGLDAMVRDYEPAEALFADNGGMAFYTRLSEVAKELLTPGGTLILEIHSPKAEEVRAVFEDSGWQGVRIVDDLAGKPRFAICQLPRP